MLTSQLFADASSQSETVLLWTLVLSSLGGLVTGILSLVKGYLSDKQALEMRNQDRLDNESKAKLLLATVEAKEREAQVAAMQREKRIVAKIDENTEVSKTAFREANGIKAELASHAADVKVATETIAAATKEVAAARAEGVLLQEGGGTAG